MRRLKNSKKRVAYDKDQPGETNMQEPMLQLSPLVEAINAQPKTETRSMKVGKYTGYALGPLASAVVAPFAFKFGERLSGSMGFEDETSKKAIGSLFATCSTIGVSSYSSFVCSDQFALMFSSLVDDTLDVIKDKSFVIKRIQLALAVAVSMIVTFPGTYLSHEVYTKLVGESTAILLDIANFLVWSTVSAWALYSIPGNAYRSLVTRYPAMSYSKHYTNRLKFLAALESIHSKAQKKTDSEIEVLETELYAGPTTDKTLVTEQWLLNLLRDVSDPSMSGGIEESARSVSGKDIAGLLGIATGFAATYFFIPAGMESGKYLADMMDLHQAEDVFAQVFGMVSFAIQGLTTALSARSCFINTYEAASSAIMARCNQTTSRGDGYGALKDADESLIPAPSSPEPAQSNTSRKALLFMLLLAFFSSAHRAEMTAEYVPNNGFGNFLIGLSMFGLFSMNFWGFEGLKKKLFSPPLSENRQAFFSKVKSTVTVIESANDDYITASQAKVQIRGIN